MRSWVLYAHAVKVLSWLKLGLALPVVVFVTGALSLGIHPLGLVSSAFVWFVVWLWVRSVGSRSQWVTVLVIAVYVINWSPFAPRAWFEIHRPLYALGANSVDRGASAHGATLPIGLRGLSVSGDVEFLEGTIFFPQWMGSPDDAGGYFYSPTVPPEELDMHGMLCRDPVNFGDGWWSCGM